MNGPPDSLETLRSSVRDFVQCIEALPDALWLRKIIDWTPRDIVAHLIGWNVYVREGCELLRARKAPPFLNDREHDYRHVNAASVARYAARDRRTLLGELEISFRNLERYLVDLDPVEWDADTGVRIKGRPVTIRNSIRAFARDYDNHRQRIDRWQTAPSSDGSM